MVYNVVHTSQQTLEGKSIFNQHLCIPLSSHQEEKDVIYFLLYIVLIVWSIIYIFLDGYETQYIKIGFKKWQNIRQNMTNEIQSLKTIKICKNLMIWYFYNLYNDVCFIVFSMEAVDNMLHYVPLFCFLSRSILLHPSLLSLCILNPHIIFIADKNTGNLLTTCF